MKTQITLGALIFSSFLTVQPVQAQGSVQHSGKALEHGANSVGHSVVGGSKLVAGTVAIPLAAAGSVGRASGKVGKDMWDHATAPIGEPLPITEDTVTAGPSPAKAMQVEGDQI
ncbi:hypothetical protein [Kaarinaea lacus]